MLWPITTAARLPVAKYIVKHDSSPNTKYRGYSKSLWWRCLLNLPLCFKFLVDHAALVTRAVSNFHNKRFKTCTRHQDLSFCADSCVLHWIFYSGCLPISYCFESEISQVFQIRPEPIWYWYRSIFNQKKKNIWLNWTHATNSRILLLTIIPCLSSITWRSHF